MTREQPDRTRTTAEWAKELGCSVDVIRYAIRKRKLLATRDRFKRGHTYLIRARDIKHWLDGLEYGQAE